MELKTISDCLSAIDFAIVENVRLLSIKNLEDIHNRPLDFRQSEYIEKKTIFNSIKCTSVFHEMQSLQFQLNIGKHVHVRTSSFPH